MKLLVGLPAFNEAATIAAVIAAIPRDIAGIDRVDVLVVDDGSTDGTGELARGAGAIVHRHVRNEGFGRAFQTMVRQAIARGADILVTIDADGQFDPTQIPTLIAPILAGDAQVCTASRFLDPTLTPTMPWIKKWGNSRVAGLVSLLTGRRYHDVSCGFRAYHREPLFWLTVQHSFTCSHETFLDLAAKRIDIREIPLAVRGEREHGESKIASSVWRYAWRTSLIMLRTYRDYLPLSLAGWVAGPLAVLGTALLAASFMNLLQTNSWLKSIAFIGGAFIGVAVLILLLGFLADMTCRLRRNQEEILYWLRRNAAIAGAHAGSESGDRRGDVDGSTG